MRKLCFLSTLVLTVLVCTPVSGQDFSNKGKDFWVGYGYHERMIGGGNSQDMVLYFATDQVTNITITIPATGYTQTITTPAGNNVITSAPIPKAPGPGDVRLLTEGTSNNGIHITSDKPMVAYAHIYNQSVSGATILYPTNTLGRECYSVNYKNWSNLNNANSWFYVIATDTGTTTVEITPSANTTGGWIAGTTYTVSLTQGQIYNVMGILTGGGPPPGGNPFTGVDLTGSKIESINTGSGCKKIAVFSGSGRISITCNLSSSSSDNYMVQAMPKNAWGKKYLTVQANGNQSNNIYRICVSNPAAIVRINGAITGLPLINNFYYEISATNQPQLIESDSAIMVAQYFTSQGACGNGGNPGDPEVIYLSAVEQNINRVLWNATPNFAITAHSFNVVIPNTGTALSSFSLDGAPVGGFIVHPQDPGYSYLRQSVAPGFHIIQSDSGFNAIAYGFGNAESYGYNAGTNIKDLYQQIGVTTEYGIETTPSVCTNSPFKFKVSLPYCADSITWDLSNLPGPPAPSIITMVYSTCTPGAGGPDSTTVVNGRTIYWYSLPTFYSFSTVGVFPVNILTYSPNGECGTVQEIDFDLTVSNPPVADFTWTSNGCATQPVQFIETTPQVPKPTYSFWWDFGDPPSGAANNSTLRNPVHLFSGPGTYTVRYAAITTPGCLTDTVSHQVTVDAIPTALFSVTPPLCPNVPVTFTDQSTASGSSTLAQWTWDFGDGSPIVVRTSSTNEIHTYTLPGTYNATLQVETSTGCQSTVFTFPVVILQDGTIALSSAPGTDNQTVCINTPIINITYAVGGSSNGGSVTGLPAGVTGTYAGGVITITGTPTVAGTFNYTVNTTGPCVNPSTTGTITVTPDGTVTLTSAPGTDNQTLCINTALTPITYAVGGSGTGGSVTGLPAGVTGTFAGGVITITGTPTVAGTFNYTVNTTGPCVNPTANGTITVTPDGTVTLTSAPGTDNQTVCINAPIVNITYAVGGSGNGGSVTGLPAGVSGTSAGGVIDIA
ncbi:MAG: PKD domain-containing protein, partial [Bacteroidota bacterium]